MPLVDAAGGYRRLFVRVKTEVKKHRLLLPIKKRTRLLGDLASVIRSIDHIQTVAARDPFFAPAPKALINDRKG
jgi:hypothetical protein